MAGNSWQQPVAGEPSLGTPHYHKETLVNDADPSNTSNITVTCSDVPVGTTAIAGYFNVLSTSTAGRAAYIKYDNTSTGTVVSSTRNPTTAIYGYNWFLVPLNSDRQFLYSVDNADVDHVYIYQILYYI